MSPSTELLIRSLLSEYTGTEIRSVDVHPVGGGSINQTYRLRLNRQHFFFCKVNDASRFPALFEKERQGLELLGSHRLIRVPQTIAHYSNSEQILVLEWIEQGTRSAGFWTDFGEQLARLHEITNPFFGLGYNNYMGALPQSNNADSNWCRFLVRQRLQPQVELALASKKLEPLHVRQFENLYRQLDSIFPPVTARLLHGDLWSGNFLCDDSSNPVLIDPAVYFGHPAMDLAMTTLFGGFDEGFYDAYRYHSPFPANYREQWDICNLYPLLIHLNLFGQSYLPGIARTIRRY